MPDLAKALNLPCVLRIAGGATIGALNGGYPKALAQSLFAQYRKADAIVSPTRHMAARLRSAGIAGVQVICNTVDLEHFAPREKDPMLLRALGLSDQDVVAMHVSNFKALKRARQFRAVTSGKGAL